MTSSNATTPRPNISYSKYKKGSTLKFFKNRFMADEGQKDQYLVVMISQNNTQIEKTH